MRKYVSALCGSRRGALALGLCFLTLTYSDIATADIITDGTLGRPASRLDGSDYRIPESLGKRAGNNLFHSFHTFNIYKGESALFTGSDNIRNVISRVTGGASSTIDGVLRSEVGNADFYFLNPWGVFFGADAQIDVPASFHVGTSAELTFPDGGKYSARDTDASSLSIESPEAFGFRAAKAGPITIDKSSLVFKSETTMTLAGGDLNIDSASMESASGKIRLLAAGNTNTDVSFTDNLPDAAQGELVTHNSTIRVNGDGGGYLGLAAGNIGMSASRLENTNLGDKDARQGTEIRTKTLTMTGSVILDNAQAAGNAAFLRVEAHGVGRSGSSGEKPCVLCMDNESRLYSQASGSGKAADITVSAAGKMQVVKSLIYSGTQGKGDGGEITVWAGELLLDGKGTSQKGIRTRTENFGTRMKSTGNAGGITVTVDGFLRITNRAGISSYSTDYIVKKIRGERAPRRGSISVETVGNAGSVTVQAGSLRIDGVVAQYEQSGIWSRASIYAAQRNILPYDGGNTGDVRVTVDRSLELMDQAKIYTQTAGLGDAGDVFVRAGSLRMHSTKRSVIQGSKPAEIKSTRQSSANSALANDAGKAGSVFVTVDGKLEMSGEVAIHRETFGGAVPPGGTEEHITVRAGSLLMLGKNRGMDGPSKKIDRLYPRINTATDRSAKQKPGNITVIVDGLAQLNLAEIFTEKNVPCCGEKSNVYPGEINIQSGDLKIQDSRIYTGKPEMGLMNTGNITITADGRMDLIRGEILSYGANHVGNITVKAHALSMDDGVIRNESAGKEDAKGIAITIDDKFKLWNHAKIFTNTRGTGNAGNITITVGGMMSLFDQSGIFSASQSDTSARGNAGAVIINSGALLLDNSRIFSAGAAPLIDIRLPQYYRGTGISFSRSGGTNGVSITVDGRAELLNGSGISSGTPWSGNAGPVTVKAKELIMDEAGISGGTAVGTNIVGYKIYNTTDKRPWKKSTLEQLLGWKDISSKFDGKKITITTNNGLQFTFDPAEATTSTNQYDKHLYGEGVLNYLGNNPQVAPGDTPTKITVEVAELLKLSNGAQIDTTTEGIVGAGEIDITANEMKLDNASIASEASLTSNGQVGDVRIVANTLELANGARISIQKNALIPDQKSRKLKPKKISIHAGNKVKLSSGSKISTRASGNTDAGDITLHIGHELLLKNAAITTEATQAHGNRGNGGDITIRLANSLTHLIDSRITTSSSAGEGGDIRIDSDILLLDTGFIQANTAEGAEGGNITINAEFIVPLGNRAFSANSDAGMIQATAPHGINGTISAPTIDTNLSGTLKAVSEDFQTIAKTTDNSCRVARGMVPSALIQAGRGALPADITSTWSGIDIIPKIQIEERHALSREVGKTPEVAGNKF
uniref:Filamentous hemagglutinin family N-terminal domain-containing protein n=1 Tax=Candidatus Kentrum sp. TUN TaxID=2126343 RepID=A0A450ZSM9_9GAMM|nr:MAG: filamentous hemagglutinin family N-terminal domain-containing protein [Candidatus Kentron sp. TUN]VFK63627.1 MAG: filamentous hemagglutinin family N-terminal domain-containing protein [Candidatus Kentron sp. TUN]